LKSTSTAGMTAPKLRGKTATRVSGSRQAGPLMLSASESFAHNVGVDCRKR
jgi:hypothetical protein